MKKNILWIFSILLLFVVTFSTGSWAEESLDGDIARRGREALIATGHSALLQFPEEAEYLDEWKTLYARKAFGGPCLEVKSVPDMYNGTTPNMSYLYEGTEVTVVAEHGDMSCILYDGANLKHYCRWIKSIRLLPDFPGELLTIGQAKEKPYSVRSNILTRWETPGYCRAWRNCSAFSEDISNCVGFLLEYQLISENVDVDEYWYSVYGPRKVYVSDGTSVIEVGSFAYPKAGTVHVQVWLDKPMTVKAVFTVPQCLEPELPESRQTVKEFYTTD